MSEMLEAIQADREMAASYLACVLDTTEANFARLEQVQSGARDDDLIVQFFARHRLQSVEAARSVGSGEISGQARELLAAEYYRDGQYGSAEAVRAACIGQMPHNAHVSLRAITAALSGVKEMGEALEEMVDAFSPPASAWNPHEERKVKAHEAARAALHIKGNQSHG